MLLNRNYHYIFNHYKNNYCKLSLNLNNLVCDKIKYNKFSSDSNSVSSTAQIKVGEAKTKNWKLIYNLPLIKWAAAFNKLKIYQGGITLIGAPFCFALEYSGEFLPQTGMVFSTIGITGFLTLSLTSLAFKNLIGLIYLNQDSEKVKISYIDFWGRRKNIECLIEDIVPPELEKAPLDFYQPVTIDTCNTRYKLLQRYGNINDMENFSSIFGE